MAKSQPVPAWTPGNVAAPSHASSKAAKGGNVYNFNNVGDIRTAKRIARINQGNRLKASARALSKRA